MLAWVSTGLEHERSCKHTAESPAHGEEKGVQGEGKEGEDQRENAQCDSVLMARGLSPSKAAWNRWEGIPSHPTKEAAGSAASLLLYSSVLQLLCCLPGT